MNEERSVELTIDGMTCGGCARRVTAALKAVAGVRAVTIDLSARRARVAGDSELAPEALLAAVARAGYTALPTTDAA